jgi:hypothetical protein
MLTLLRIDLEFTSVTDLVQVWELALEVAEERLHPGLVVRGGGPAEVLGDAGAGHEHRGGLGGHLRPVVRHRQQHRHPLVVIRDDPVSELVEQRRIEQVLLAVLDQSPGERHLDLRGGLLRGDHGGQPLARHHV